MKMKMVNLTPHEVTILGGPDPVVIPASGQVARVTQAFSDAGKIGIDGHAGLARTVTAAYGAVVGLPVEQVGCGYCGLLNCEHAAGHSGICECAGEPEYPTHYIVSAMVRAACPQRKDVLSPAEFERDGSGKITGCRSLERNP